MRVPCGRSNENQTMTINDKTLKVMKGLNQALATRGWCLVGGEVGVGKTSAVREALRQTGWEAVWKGWSDLEGEDAQMLLSTEPKELLALDGLVEEWVPGVEQAPDQSWAAFYAATTVAAARAKLGLMTVVCAVVHSEGGGMRPDLANLPGCVVVILP